MNPSYGAMDDPSQNLADYLQRKKIQDLISDSPTVDLQPPPTQNVGPPPVSPQIQQLMKPQQQFMPPAPPDTSMPDLTPSSTQAPALGVENPNKQVGLNQPPANPFQSPIPRTSQLTPNSPYQNPQAYNNFQQHVADFPKEENFRDPTKMQKFWGLLAGISSGIAAGPRSGIEYYNRVAHPDFMKAKEDWREQYAPKEKAAELAMREQTEQQANRRLDIQQEREDEYAKQNQSSIGRNLALAEHYAAQNPTYGLDYQEQLAGFKANAQADAKLRAQQPQWFEWTSPDGQHKVTGFYRDGQFMRPGPGGKNISFNVPDDWIQESIGRRAAPGSEYGSDWKSRIAAFVNEHGRYPYSAEISMIRKQQAQDAETESLRGYRESGEFRNASIVNRNNLYGFTQDPMGLVFQPTPAPRVGRSAAPNQAPALAPAPTQAPPNQAPPKAQTLGVGPDMKTMPASNAPKMTAPQIFTQEAKEGKPPRLTPEQEKYVRGEIQRIVANPDSWHQRPKDPYTRLIEIMFPMETGGLTVPNKVPDVRIADAEIAGRNAIRNVENVRQVFREYPGLEKRVGFVAGHINDWAAKGYLPDDLFPGMTPKLKEGEQRLAVALQGLAAQEGIMTGAGRATGEFYRVAKEAGPKYQIGMDRLNGALKEVEKMGQDRITAAMKARYGGGWTPEATQEMGPGMKHVGRETVELGDGKTAWKHIVDRSTGEKWGWREGKHGPDYYPE